MELHEELGVGRYEISTRRGQEEVFVYGTNDLDKAREIYNNQVEKVKQNIIPDKEAYVCLYDFDKNCDIAFYEEPE